MGQNGRVSDLIDTTEMYLRTIYELVEEGIVPLRARIAERLHQSGPTVSPDRGPDGARRAAHRRGRPAPRAHRRGQRLATRVMRKHRLAERLLTDVIGLDWELVHDEACRWEHVMSETVERRLRRAARPPDRVAVRQPDPGPRRARRDRRSARSSWTASSRCREAAGAEEGRVLVRRISEEMQKDEVADERAAPGRRAARQDRHRGRRPPRACWSAPAARPPRSCPRRPSTSSSASSDDRVRTWRETSPPITAPACTIQACHLVSWAQVREAPSAGMGNTF